MGEGDAGRIGDGTDAVTQSGRMSEDQRCALASLTNVSLR
jgi:hypothetical protein